MARYKAGNLDKWAAKVQRVLDAVAKQSALELLYEASEPGPTVARPSSFGTGKMPVDTGFLRHSLTISYNGVPVGPSIGDKDTEYPEPSFELHIARWRGQPVLFAGWTASYARAMEERYGFMKSAAANWSVIVNRVVARIPR